MAAGPRIGINARLQLEKRRQERHVQRRGRIRNLFRMGKSGVVVLIILAAVGTVAWGGLSLWHKMGGGVLRGIECRGDVQCLGERLMGELGLERGMPLERIELAAVEQGLIGLFSGHVDVKRDLAEGLLIVEVRPQPVLARFLKNGEWWILRSGGGVEPQERSGVEMPLLEVEGPVDWKRIAQFLDLLRSREELWKDLSLLRIEEGGRTAQAWVLSGHHRLLLPLNEEGVDGIDRYRRLLRQRPEMKFGKTIDLRFEGFAYVSTT